MDWQIEQQSHDEGWAEPFFRRINAALNEKRCSHTQRDVEGSDEPEIPLIGPFENQSIAERTSDRMCRHKNPLGAGRIAGAETFQLIDEGVRVRLNLRSYGNLECWAVTGGAWFSGCAAHCEREHFERILMLLPRQSLARAFVADLIIPIQVSNPDIGAPDTS